MATIIEVLQKMEDEKMSFQFVNGNLMQSSIGSKRSSAFIKIAVPVETAQNFLTWDQPEELGILLMVNRNEFIETNKLLDKEKAEINE